MKNDDETMDPRTLFSSFFYVKSPEFEVSKEEKGEAKGIQRTFVVNSIISYGPKEQRNADLLGLSQIICVFRYF